MAPLPTMLLGGGHNGCSYWPLPSPQRGRLSHGANTNFGIHNKSLWGMGWGAPGPYNRTHEGALLDAGLVRVVDQASGELMSHSNLPRLLQVACPRPAAGES